MILKNGFTEIIERNKLAKSFIVFSNSDNKRWIIPIKNSSTALNLYQPSALRGRLLKFFLPYMPNFKWFFVFFGIKLESFSLQNDLYVLLTKVFDKKDFEFALFGGTPSKHQKITIQIFEGNNILGYCKLTDSAEIKEIFRQEQELLDTLHLQGVKNIPRCIYCDSINDKLDIFIQSTAKTTKSRIEHGWTRQHLNFLIDLNKKTQSEVLFEESDFYNSLQLLRKNINFLSIFDATIVNTAIAKVLLEYENKTLSFSAYHADFTPWNMFFENNELFVFDFEYAKHTYPPLLDWFHYFTQVAIFKHNWESPKIYKQFQNNKKVTKKYFSNPEFSYMCYLLDIVSFYIERDKGEFSKDVEHNLKTWIKLISFL